MRRFTIISLSLLAALLVRAGVSTPAMAQYMPGEGFEIAWTLNPHDHPDLFTHGDQGLDDLGNQVWAFGARSVLVGMDFDADGAKEILFTTDETLAPGGPDPGILDVYLYEATGDNTYEHVWHYTHSEGSNSLPGLAYGDIDDDGKWEIYMGIPTIDDDPNDLFVFEQGDDMTFPDEATTRWNYDREGVEDFRPSGFVIEDVDGDGRKELLTLSRSGRDLVIATVDGDDLNPFSTWTIEFEAGTEILGGGGLYDIDVFDFDGDGMNEVWVNTWNNFSMSVWEITAPDTYELQTDLDELFPVNDPGSFNSHDLLTVDVDGDGKLEMYLPMTDGKLYFLDDVDDVSAIVDSTSFQIVGTFDPTARSRGAHIGDIDMDGYLDIVATHGTSEKVSRIEYDGVGAPADSASYEWSILLDSSADTVATERYYPLRIADDLDGDGMNEVVVTNLFASQEGQPMIIVLEYVGVEVANERMQLPRGYELDQNYPNPFNPATTISFTLAEPQDVTLQVFDVTGRLVRTLLSNRGLATGVHQIEWNGTNSDGITVPSGMYLYRLSFGETQATRRMVLLK